MPEELITLKVRRDDLKTLIHCGWKLGHNQTAYRIERACEEAVAASTPADATETRPAEATSAHLPPHADAILRQVIEAMQPAEEMGGPVGADYRNLMRAIAHEAANRVLAQLSHESPGTNLLPLADQLRGMLATQVMAYDRASIGFTDEALLHLGMLGVYIQRALANPLVQPHEDATPSQ